MSKTYHPALVPAFKTTLLALSGILAKAEAFCQEKDIEESVLLDFRFYPDMMPFSRQVQTACDFVKNAPARLVGEEPKSFEDDEQSFDALRQRIDSVLAILESYSVESLRVDESVMLEVPAGPNGKIRFKDLDTYFHSFAVPNFYFHCATAYNMLRHNGLEIGKLDFIGPVDAELLPA